MIAELSRQTFIDTFAEYNTPENMQLFLDESFSTSLLEQEVGAPDNFFLIAEDGSEVRGYARLRVNNQPPELGNEKTLEIARIYATKESIGLGVGRLLMEGSIAMASSLQKDIIWLGVWENNTRAITFYTKWGFEKFGDHIFMLGNDKQKDWLMRRRV